MRTDRNQTFDGDGNLLHEEVVEVDDDPTTPEERIAALEAEIQGMKQRAGVAAAKATPTAKAVAQAVTGDA